MMAEWTFRFVVLALCVAAAWKLQSMLMPQLLSTFRMQRQLLRLLIKSTQTNSERLERIDLHTTETRELAHRTHDALSNWTKGTALAVLLTLVLAAGAARADQPLAFWGLPEGTPIAIGASHTMAIAFDGRTRCPRWAMQYETPATIKGEAQRGDRFFADARIPREFRPRLSDYAGSGYQRGHAMAAGDCHTQADMDASFSLANMMPQLAAVNEGVWKSIERECHQACLAHKRSWIVTGPLWRLRSTGAHVPAISLAGDVWVPHGFFKSMLWVDDGPKLRSWIARNDEHNPATPDGCLATVDEIEHVAGLDLWAGLPDEIEARLEASK